MMLVIVFVFIDILKEHILASSVLLGLFAPWR